MRSFPHRITITAAVVLLSVTEASGEGMADFSGDVFLPKGGMLMEVICILLSMIACLTAYLALGLVILSSADNEKDRPSDQD